MLVIAPHTLVPEVFTVFIGARVGRIGYGVGMGSHLRIAIMALSPLMRPRGAVSRVRGMPW